MFALKDLSLYVVQGFLYVITWLLIRLNLPSHFKIPTIAFSLMGSHHLLFCFMRINVWCYNCYNNKIKGYGIFVSQCWHIDIRINSTWPHMTGKTFGPAHLMKMPWSKGLLDFCVILLSWRCEFQSFPEHGTKWIASSCSLCLPCYGLVSLFPLFHRGLEDFIQGFKARPAYGHLAHITWYLGAKIAFACKPKSGLSSHGTFYCVNLVKPINQSHGLAFIGRNVDWIHNL